MIIKEPTLSPQQRKDVELAYAAYQLLPAYIRVHIMQREIEAAEAALCLHPEEEEEAPRRPFVDKWMLNFPDPPGYAENLPEEQPQPATSLPDEADVPVHYHGGKPPSYAERIVPTPGKEPEPK